MAAVLPAPQAWSEPSGCRMRRDVSMLFQLEQARLHVLTGSPPLSSGQLNARTC